MTSAKRPRESPEASSWQDVGWPWDDDTAKTRRRSSCIRAGGVFLQQLENNHHARADANADADADGAAERSPIVLPSLRKLRLPPSTAKKGPFASPSSASAPSSSPGCSAWRAVEAQGDQEVGQEDDEGGFKIHCSQNYERHAAAEHIHEEEAEEAQAKATQLEDPASPEDFAQENKSTQMVMKTPTYAIFRPPSEKKTVYIIRHGESVYNAMDTYGRSLEDPFVFDAPLTEIGKKQARDLRDELCAISSSALWVASPLTRCLQTMLTAYSQYLKHASYSDEPKIKVCSYMAEHLCTTGDIGRPKSHLMRDFPNISKALSSLSEVWWWSPEDRPNDALKQLFNCREPKHELKKRVGLFRQWVLKQPHQEIIAFGHSTFWKEFSGSSTRLRNCEVEKLTL